MGMPRVQLQYFGQDDTDLTTSKIMSNFHGQTSNSNNETRYHKLNLIVLATLDHSGVQNDPKGSSTNCRGRGKRNSGRTEGCRCGNQSFGTISKGQIGCNGNGCVKSHQKLDAFFDRDFLCSD
jgi:hypothetical protein